LRERRNIPHPGHLSPVKQKETAMKLATLGLTTALVLTNSLAFAQSGTGSTGGAAAGGSTSSGSTTGTSGSTTGGTASGGLGGNAGSAAAGANSAVNPSGNSYLNPPPGTAAPNAGVRR
jgi:hypothetical protein